MKQHLFTLFHQYVLNSSEATVYGLFDGVKYPMLHDALEEGMLEYDILFREEALREKLQDVAPFFVKLDMTNEEAQQESMQLMECYGQNGCIFLASILDFEESLEAMREIFYIYTPDGKKGYLRFYAPDIFAQYIAQKDPNARYTLFADIACYWCEDEENTEILVQYTLNRGQVQKRAFELKDVHEN